MHINIQPIEKQTLAPQLLQIHSVFYTLQGEGPFTGHPSIFIRLAGCNLQCPGCDTDYTTDRIESSPHVITERMRPLFPANAKHQPLVVITGGEPMRQNIGPLVKRLLKFGYRVQIETNGTLFVPDLPYEKLTIVCSPKTGKINSKLLPHITAFKYVASADAMNSEDGLPITALGHSAVPQLARPPAGDTRPIYVQPMDMQDEKQNLRNTAAVIGSCMKFGYIFQLQTHKIIGME